MANISFKKGLFKDFEKSILGITKTYDDNNNLVITQGEKNIQEGTLYFTEDEGCLYVGAMVDDNNPETPATLGVKRIQGSVICYDNVFKFKEEVIDHPPYSTDVIYFISQDNALIKWNATDKLWIQLNVTVDQLNKEITNINGALAAEVKRATEKETEIDESILGITQEIGTIQSSLLDFVKVADYTAYTQATDGRLGPLETLTTNLSTDVSKIKEMVDISNETFVINKDFDVSGKKIIDLADGINDDDAVNLKQLNAVKSQVEELKTSSSNTSQSVATSISNLQTSVDTINSTIDKVVKIDATNGTIQVQNNLDINNKIVSNLSMRAENILDTDATNVKYVNTLVETRIKANDAMTFKGTLGSDEDCTLTTLQLVSGKYTVEEEDSILYDQKPQQGDTFKVAVAGSYAGVNAKVGDLFINNAPDDTEPNWVHISSGYEDTYLQKLVLSSKQDSIILSDGVSHSDSGKISGISFISDNDNITFSISQNAETENLQVKASMTWGSFTSNTTTN